MSKSWPKTVTDMHSNNTPSDAPEPASHKHALAEGAAAPEDAKRARVGDEPPNALAKRKVALLLAYNGDGYSGLQINPDVETIEKTLEEAIYRAGGISEANHGVTTPTLQKVSWSRAGRTDKGVHAVGQIISLKMILEPESMLDRINEQLTGSGVQLLAYERVNNSFCAHTMCSAREYEYLLPERILAPSAADAAPSVPTDAAASIAADAAVVAPNAAATAIPGAAAATVPLSPDGVSRLRKLLRKLEGTHSFHNFTDVKVTSADKTATRFMISFTTGEPLELAGVSYVPFRFHGQSFLLHQIRKMVGLVVATFRGDVPPDAIDVAFGPGRIAPIPMAPSCALVLRRCLYTPYERKRNAEKFCDRNSVHFPAQDAAKEAFLTTSILPHIAKAEASGEFDRFAEALGAYTIERPAIVAPVDGGAESGEGAHAPGEVVPGVTAEASRRSSSSNAPCDLVGQGE